MEWGKPALGDRNPRVVPVPQIVTCQRATGQVCTPIQAAPPLAGLRARGQYQTAADSEVFVDNRSP
jgi:hypothetical protein